MAWHCSSIYKDLQRFTRNLQHLSAKLFLLLFLNNFKQICANLQKSENNMMSNDGLIIENMDLSHIHLAVGRPFILKFACNLTLKDVTIFFSILRNMSLREISEDSTAIT